MYENETLSPRALAYILDISDRSVRYYLRTHTSIRHRKYARWAIPPKVARRIRKWAL